MVRIHLPPAVSLRTFGSGGELPPRDDIVPDAFLGQATVSKRQPTGGGLRVRIQFPPAVSQANFRVHKRSPICGAVHQLGRWPVQGLDSGQQWCGDLADAVPRGQELVVKITRIDPESVW